MMLKVTASEVFNCLFESSTINPALLPLITLAKVF